MTVLVFEFLSLSSIRRCKPRAGQSSQNGGFRKLTEESVNKRQIAVPLTIFLQLTIFFANNLNKIAGYFLRNSSF